MTERLRRQHFERRRCAKGQSERIKEEKGNEKETVKHGELEKRGPAGSEGGLQRVRRRIIHHVAECFVWRITGRRRGFGKKAKIWRGWGAYEGEDGIGARKNGWEGEEIGGEKMYRGGLGTGLDYFKG